MKWIGRHIYRFLALLLLLLLFIYEVCVSSMKVLWWIYTRGSKIESEIISVPLEVKKTWQKILIAHFITLTPGTLAIELSENNTVLVHCLDRNSAQDTIALVRTKIEPLLRSMEARS